MSEHKTLELPYGALKRTLAPAVRDLHVSRSGCALHAHNLLFAPPLFENPGSAPDSQKRYIK